MSGGMDRTGMDRDAELAVRRRAEMLHRIETAYFSSLSSTGVTVTIERLDLKALLALASTSSLYPAGPRGFAATVERPAPSELDAPLADNDDLSFPHSPGLLDAARESRAARDTPRGAGRRESLPWLLRNAAVDPGGFGPTHLAALLEEAAQEIAEQNAQRDVATEGEPMRSVNLSPLDLEEAIQNWVGERYGFLEGWWKATVKLPDEHSCVVAWQLEDEPLDEEDKIPLRNEDGR